MKIGIIGNGVVGNATATIFANPQVLGRDDVAIPLSEIRRWDVDATRATHSFPDTVDVDYLFACVPTPEGKYSLNVSHLVNLVHILKQEGLGKPTLVVRSTLNVGDTVALAKLHEAPVIYWPEFLTERKAIEDALNPPLTLMGYSPPYCGAFRKFCEFAMDYVGHINFAQSKDVELAKLLSNACGAVQVALANEVYRIAESYGIDTKQIIPWLITLKRLNREYSSVPGPDGMFGFGGKCFPKDLGALLSNPNSVLMRAAAKRNMTDRNESK